jgi:hypothetical protein
VFNSLLVILPIYLLVNYREVELSIQIKCEIASHQLRHFKVSVILGYINSENLINDPIMCLLAELSSAYETLSNPTRRRDYNISGRRYHSQNSEETLSNALAQVSLP